MKWRRGGGHSRLESMQPPQWRRDPFSGRWSILAPERAARPQQLTDPWRGRRDWDLQEQSGSQACPFCPGQEEQTPPAVLVFADSELTGQSSWRLRVVPNKYPALRPDVGGVWCRIEGEAACGPGVGRSEVVIETPRHITNPTQMTDAELADVFRAYRQRLLALAAEELWAFAAVFKNVGAEAGASLLHTHSQIIALPLVPPWVAHETTRCRNYRERTGRCLTCHWLEQENRDGARLVARSEHFTVLTAYAPRFPYELWLTSRRHLAHFEEMDESTLQELAWLWKRVLLAVDTVWHGPAYNWMVVTAPWGMAASDAVHWRLELLPRLARPAGLEWGYGCFISPITPEEAAERLRAALSREGVI